MASMRWFHTFSLVGFLGLLLSAQSASFMFRSCDHPGHTRVVLEGDQALAYSIEPRDEGMAVLLQGVARVSAQAGQVKSRRINRFQSRVQGEQTEVLIQGNSRMKVLRSFALEKPFRIVLDLQPDPQPAAGLKPEAAKPRQQEQVTPQTVTPPPPSADEAEPVPGEPAQPPPHVPRNIEVICLDPGHGGADLGAVGPGRLLEKEVTLDVTRRVRKRLETRLGIRVVMTREDDAEVSLNRRAAIANNQKAQLFVSIHANSSYRSQARGSETFYVSLTASDQDASDLAARENLVGDEGNGPAAGGGGEDLKMILWNMAQNEHVKESSVLADMLQVELNDLLDTRNRGVKQAPFRVLMRASMPAVLVEAAFISNPEERMLKDNVFLDRLAEAIYR